MFNQTKNLKKKENYKKITTFYVQNFVFFA